MCVAQLPKCFYLTGRSVRFTHNPSECNMYVLTIGLQVPRSSADQMKGLLF